MAKGPVPSGLLGLWEGNFDSEADFLCSWKLFLSCVFEILFLIYSLFPGVTPICWASMLVSLCCYFYFIC